MAGYKGHLAGAMMFFVVYLVGLVFIFSVDRAYDQFGELELVAYPLVLFALCLMFALWPDVDTNSKGQNFFYGIFFVADVILIAAKYFEGAAYLGLFAILPALGKHRGWTHTWWAMLLVPLPLLILPYLFAPERAPDELPYLFRPEERPLAGLPFYGAAVVGYFSHLFMDGLIIPFKRKRRATR